MFFRVTLISGRENKLGQDVLDQCVLNPYFNDKRSVMFCLQNNLRFFSGDTPRIAYENNCFSIFLPSSFAPHYLSLAFIFYFFKKPQGSELTRLEIRKMLLSKAKIPDFFKISGWNPEDSEPWQKLWFPLSTLPMKNFF